jgi:hypothetical protein
MSEFREEAYPSFESGEQMTSKRIPGNGSGKFEIYQHDMGGWVRIYIDATAAVPENVASFLSLSLTDWFRKRPHLRMRNVLPVTRNGETVELHAWYDQQVFPDLSGHKPDPVPPNTALSFGVDVRIIRLCHLGWTCV